jgi:hypothetical protein
MDSDVLDPDEEAMGVELASDPTTEAAHAHLLPRTAHSDELV